MGAGPGGPGSSAAGVSSWASHPDSAYIALPRIRVTVLKNTCYFADVTSEVLSVLEEVVKKSTFVSKVMLPYWEAALIRFRSHR